MTKYVKTELYLSPTQQKTLKEASDAKTSFEAAVDKTLPANVALLLTAVQHKAFNSAGVGYILKMSKTQVDRNRIGGFIGFLTALAVAAATALAAGASSHVGKKIAEKVVGKGMKAKRLSVRVKGSGLVLPGSLPPSVGAGLVLPGSK